MRNRLCGLRVLQELASVTYLRSEIWTHDIARSAVLAAAVVTNCSEKSLRESAFRILMSCSSDKSNKDMMWQDDATRAALCAGVRSGSSIFRRVRICAAGALQNLSSVPELKAGRGSWREGMSMRGAA